MPRNWMKQLGARNKTYNDSRRTNGRLRLPGLIAATMLTAGLWTLNSFHSFVVGAEFLTTIVDRDSQYGFDPKAGISNLYLGYWTAFIGSTRHGVGFGREMVPAWGDDPVAADYPRTKYRWSCANRYPYSFFEFTDWSNWHIAGLGTYHDDIHPLGGLTARPYDERAVMVPYWLIATIIAAFWWRRWKRWRVHRRVVRGGCPYCGYDLRGSPAVGMLVACPECGEATISTTASSCTM